MVPNPCFLYNFAPAMCFVITSRIHPWKRMFRSHIKIRIQLLQVSRTIFAHQYITPSWNYAHKWLFRTISSLLSWSNSPPVLDEFERLRLYQHWQMGSKDYRKCRNQCLKLESEHHLGQDSSKLERWQSLCDEVHIDLIPVSITQCKKVHTLVERQ